MSQYRLRVSTRGSFGSYFSEISASSYDQAIQIANLTSMKYEVEFVRILHKSSDSVLWDLIGDCVNGKLNIQAA